MIFNGCDLSKWFSVSFERRISPELDVATRDVPGLAGARFVRAKVKPIVIPMKLRWRARPGASMARLRREVAPVLMASEPRPLVLDDEPDVHYMAIMTTQAALSNLWYTGTCDIEFTAYDPIAYGRDRETSLSPAATFEVGGTWPTEPIVTARPGGSVSFLRLTDNATGRFVQVTAALTSSSVVVFDMAAPNATVNGANAPVTFESDFFALEPGVASLRLSSGTGTVAWTERWR